MHLKPNKGIGIDVLEYGMEGEVELKPCKINHRIESFYREKFCDKGKKLVYSDKEEV